MTDDPRRLFEGLLARRAELERDPHRPRFHFLPPGNWMNDPNGLIQWKGEYHVFYQHNPCAPTWGPMYWGHAASRDLLHWRHLPLALAPGPEAYDKDGVWSGCAVDNEGAPTAMYTGIRPQVQCIATGDDELLTWTKHPANPVIPAPPKGVLPDRFRDPCAWREGKEWFVAVGAGTADESARVLLYRSPDLVRWEYLQPLLEGRDMAEPAGAAKMWECPSFFPLEGRHVLIVSCVRRDDRGPGLRVAWMVGAYAGGRFAPERSGTLDLGSDYYAPQTMLDERGRRLMWGWIGEGRSVEAQKAAGWAGVLSLPCELALGPGGILMAEPAAELRALRRGHRRFEDVLVSPGHPALSGEIEGDMLEIDAAFQVGGASRVGVKLRASPAPASAGASAGRPGGEEETVVAYDAGRRRLELDRSRASLDPAGNRTPCGGPMPLPADGRLRLRIFLDRSVVEVYAAGACLTSRVFPSRLDSTGVSFFAEGGAARIESLDVWEMSPLLIS